MPHTNNYRREALYIWKTRTGSKATYAKLIKIFEQAGYKSYADEVRRIAHINNSDIDDSSGSGEERRQIEQPPTYPDYKPHALPEVPQPMTSSDSAEIYVMVEEEGKNWSNGTRLLWLLNRLYQFDILFLGQTGAGNRLGWSA